MQAILGSKRVKMNEKDQSIRFTQEYYSTGCNLKEPDVFRREYPDHVKRIAMAAPRFAITDKERKKDIANIYEVDFDFLKRLTNYTYIYDKSE